ncbi:hypothetical protein PSPO01_13557 [Paraphaeosphaeria sporulosa]
MHCEVPTSSRSFHHRCTFYYNTVVLVGPFRCHIPLLFAMPLYWTNRLLRRMRRCRRGIKISLYPRPSQYQHSNSSQEPISQQQRASRQYQETSQRCPIPSRAQISLSTYPCSSTSTSTSTTARKLVKAVSTAKKRPMHGSPPLVIGGPQGFKKGTEAADLMLQLGIPILRGAGDRGNETISKSVSPDDAKGSMLSLLAFAKEYRLPPRTSSMAAPPLAHRHKSPPKMARPNPLRSHPPEPVRPPPPPAVELEGSSPPSWTSRGHSRGSNNSEALKAHRHSVIYGGFESGSPFFPIVEEVEDMPLPESGYSDSSGQVTPNAGPKHRNTAIADTKARSSRLLTIGKLPLEMREPLKIWQKYMRTGVIDVDMCPEALDSEGNSTWMHCWGLFNLYTFSTSFMNDTEFADRVMDMLCKNLNPGKAADVDTICLLFTGESISTKLKQLVVDRCIDGELKNFRRSVTRNLPHEFAAVALEAAMERLADSEWRQRLESPCRYHRHKSADDCYLRKLANERHRRILKNRKTRKSRAATQAPLELGTMGPEKTAAECTNGEGIAVQDEVIPAPSTYRKIVNDPEDEGDQTSTPTSESVSIGSVQEADLDTDESSVIAALRPEDSNLSTAKSCEVVKTARMVSVVNVTATPRPEPENSFQCSKSSREARGGQTIVDKWPSLSQSVSIGSNGLLMPGAYPEVLCSVGHAV